MKQCSFFKNKDFPVEFGGELLENKRKCKRPLSVKKAAHLVMRTDYDSKSLLKHRGFINSTLTDFSQKFGVKIYERGLEKTHLHLVIKFDSVEDYKSFIRAVSGVLAKILKIKWLWRPFTKVIEWGCHFRKACAYVLQNEREGLGIVRYKK